ncbi:hypothetical protein [Micromonospora sp. NPDC092111]|uniref:hypothetical protein n=1 Tax=Micromonospora sp. NPDC092111 TaxID=3364289 RepID=UPI0037FF6665
MTATVPVPVLASASTAVRPPSTAGSCATPTPTSTASLAAVAARASSATVLAYPRAARPVLRDLASRLTPHACDLVGGRFDLVHHLRWHREPAGGGMEVRDIIRWYDQDGHGAALTTQYPPAVVDVVRDYWTPFDPFDPRLAGTFTDATFLHAYLQARNTSTRLRQAEAVLSGLAVLSTWHSPRRPGRTLAVTALADTPGMTAYPHTTDRAGRAGIGIAATTADGLHRHLLILDAATGDVLAYEQATLTPSGWQVDDYLLPLTHTHTTHRWWQPPTTDDGPASPSPAQWMPRPRSRSIGHTDQPCTPAPNPTPEKASPR